MQQAEHARYPLTAIIPNADKLYALRGRLERKERKATTPQPRTKGERSLVDQLIKAMS